MKLSSVPNRQGPDPGRIVAQLKRLVHYTAPSDDICHVSADHYGGAVQAMVHLIGCGHQKIGLMAGRFSPQIYACRYQAYTDTLKKHHIPLDYRYIQTIDAKVEDAKHCVETMLGLPDPPTALFCTNDTIAVGAIKAATALHKRLPDDLAIAGFIDSPICSMMEPEITSVHIDTFPMGEISANMLVALIEKKSFPYAPKASPRSWLFGKPPLCGHSTIHPVDFPLGSRKRRYRVGLQDCAAALQSGRM